MFRSLFISFLILSALTSNSVRLQINQNIIEISPDMLLKLFNASILNGDKQDEELSTSGEQDEFFYAASIPCSAIEKHQREMKRHSQAVWIIGPHCPVGDSLQCTDVSQRQEWLYKEEVSASGTDPSPPRMV